MKDSLKLYYSYPYWKSGSGYENVLCVKGLAAYFRIPFRTERCLYIVVSDRKPDHVEWYKVRRSIDEDYNWEEPVFDMEGDGNFVDSPKGSLGGLDGFIRDTLKRDKTYYIWLEQDTE